MYKNLLKKYHQEKSFHQLHINTILLPFLWHYQQLNQDPMDGFM